jgi:hypothetical protein
MSFYQGDVVTLRNLRDSIWKVISVHYLDTNCDSNIHTNFMYEKETRVVIIPISSIENFDSTLTKHIESSFDTKLGTEHWKALNDFKI